MRAVTAIFERAVASGDIRPDIDPVDLLRSILGVTYFGASEDWEEERHTPGGHPHPGISPPLSTLSAFKRRPPRRRTPMRTVFALCLLMVLPSLPLLAPAASPRPSGTARRRHRSARGNPLGARRRPRPLRLPEGPVSCRHPTNGGPIRRPDAERPHRLYRRRRGETPGLSDRLRHPGAAGRLGLRLAESAKSYLGVPYRRGGHSQEGMDSAAFVRAVYQATAFRCPVGRRSGRDRLRRSPAGPVPVASPATGCTSPAAIHALTTPASTWAMATSSTLPPARPPGRHQLPGRCLLRPSPRRRAPLRRAGHGQGVRDATYGR